MEHVFKVAVVGDGAVGKTSLVKRITTGEYRRIHYPTLGVEASRYLLHTTRGRVLFDIRDCAGIDRFGGHLSGFFLGSDAAIAVFALDSLDSYNSIPNWISLVHSECGDIPVVVCGNKTDSPNHEVDIEHVSAPDHSMYLAVSARNWTGLHEIFLRLARRLLRDSELRAVEAPAVGAPVVRTRI